MITKHELTPDNPTIRVCGENWVPLKIDVMNGRLMIWIDDPDRGLNSNEEQDQWINLYQTGEVPLGGDSYINTVAMPGNFLVHAYRPLERKYHKPTFESFGVEPVDHGKVELDLSNQEMLQVLYMPVKMAGDNFWKMTEPRLQKFWPILDQVRATRHVVDLIDKYIYLTAKVSWVGPGASANRPGWHGDGFGTDDLNFVWHDSLPTRVAVQPFWISNNHVASMRQFEAQVREESVRTYPNRHLIEMDQHVVHAVADPPESGHLRTFVKVSISTSKYNLVGNTHNYDFGYQWKMFDRATVRNDPIHGEQDSFPEVYPV